ncbi:hypothetical protein KP509_33G012800 [Ceratopteris richardii]|uniref:Uncharacterized protein n=1 Tax=Ceratopteris richardii TaxID=49495 RepID=A0A8T2QP63_CERRI|nr:hypothetical protein KP509_33G012800 [Ceratopteris richardii]
MVVSKQQQQQRYGRGATFVPSRRSSVFATANSTTNGSPAFTFGKRTPPIGGTSSSARENSATPGPAEYFPCQPLHSPAFSMGKKAPPPGDGGTPGPGSYFVLSTLPLLSNTRNSPAFTLTSRPFLATAPAKQLQGDATPGPGSYEITSSFVSGPKFTIRTRKPLLNKDSLPGPGSYFVNHSRTSYPLCRRQETQNL